MNNYSNTEKSLKRWLKRKAKITLGMVVAFMIMGTVGFAEIQPETITGEEPFILNSGEKYIKQDNLNMNFDKNELRRGILIEPKTNTETSIAKAKIETLNDLKIFVKHYDAVGICTRNGGELDINSKNVVINSLTEEVDPAETRPAYQYSIAMGIDVDNHPDSSGLKKGGKVNITADTVNITAEAKQDAGWAYGINCITRTTDLGKDDVSRIIIDAKDTKITAISKTKGASNGIIAWSQGEVLINNGNVSITADNIINTRLGKVHINENNNSQNTVKLNGDIIFAYNGENSGTPIESDIKINLSNSDSKFTGSVYKVIEKNFPDGKTEEQKKELLSVSSMELGISNGATWEVTGDSFINKLDLNNGVINIKKSTEEIKEETVLDEDLQVKDGKVTLNVDNLKGNGGTVTFETEIDGKELKVAEGNLRIREGAAKGTNLQVGLSGVNTDDLAGKNISARTALKELAGKVTGVGAESIDQTLFVNGGALTGKITAEVGEKGEIVNMQQVKDTPITAAVRDLTGINYLSWKQEMSSLSQRMGELRDSSAEHGVWARVYGGKVENGSQYDNEYQTYQVGYDKKYSVDNGRIYLGYLISYTDGETDYNYGSGENYSVGAGIYATWMNNNGHYVDVLYKVSRLNNKFDMADVENLKGDYDTYGISLSAEYGKRFDITEKWFTEPSIGMHLGRLGEETYTTNTGIEISQDSIYTAEGRIGTALGYKFNDNGNIYVRTHVVKEFAGDVDTEYERNGVSAKTSEDFGDTWFEFGIGANYRFAENINVYADIEKSGDSTVDTKWQGNLGFRYEF